MHTNDCNEQKNQHIQNSIRIQALETQNLNLMKENENKLITIKSLKRKNINLNSKYMNLKMAYETNIQENKLNQIEKKHFIQNAQKTGQIQRYTKNSLMYVNNNIFILYRSTHNDNTLTNKNRISRLIQNEEYSKNNNTELQKQNSELLTNIKVLKAETENHDYRIDQNNSKFENEQRKQKYYLLNLKDMSRSEQNKNILLQ